MRVLTVAVLLVAAIGAPAQPAPETKRGPSSKAERFVSERGVVFVRTFATVGVLRGQFGSSVEVTARTYTHAENGARAYAIGFSVTEGGDRRMARTERAVVDLDDIKDLMGALEHLRSFKRPSQAHGMFEASYHAPGGLKVTVFDDSKGELAIAITAGETIESTAHAQVEKLPELIELVALAEDKLKALQAAAP